MDTDKFILIFLKAFNLFNSQYLRGSFKSLNAEVFFQTRLKLD